LRCEKRKYLREILDKAELDYKSYKTRDMYKQISRLTGGYKKKDRFLKNDDGSLIPRAKRYPKDGVSTLMSYY